MRFCCISIFVLTFGAVAAAETKDNNSAGRTRKEKPLVGIPDTMPAPKDNPSTKEKVTLGKQLFFDPRLSGDNKMSCATCHMPDKAWGDGLAEAKGARGKILQRNTQTVLNVGLHSSFFWDGRAKSLEEQALAPIQSPDEMDQNLDELQRELNAIPGYVKQFKAVFGTDAKPKSIAKALAAFQRTLMSRRSPLDRFLAGDKSALSRQAKRGMELFKGEAGCVRCHRGPLLSDGKFYRLGVSFKDVGRSQVTGNRDDKYKFRTPSLRNVAETAPYMHDGSLKTLDDVVMFYFRDAPTVGPERLPLDIEPLLGQSFSDMSAIVAFLKALSGSLPDVTSPKLP